MPDFPVPGHDRHPRGGQGPWQGRILYPVLSRRSGGPSLGINLFPDAKTCDFDCAYCEVEAGRGGPAFDIAGLERELGEYAARDVPGGKGDRLCDIAFSGDGEPTLSPFLGEALAAAAGARARWPEVYGGTRLILITNSTGFLDPGVTAILHRHVELHGLEIWAKLDAGTEDWYRRIDRRGPSLEVLADGIGSFAHSHSIVLQTMRCLLAPFVGGQPAAPPAADEEAYAALLSGLLGRGARFGEIHLYTLARRATSGLCSALPDAELAALGARLVAGLGSGFRHGLPGSPAAVPPPVRVFGQHGEIPIQGDRR